MSDIKAIQKEREAAKAKLAEIEAKLKAAEAEKFTSLPQQVGLKSVNALVTALIPYTSGGTKKKLKMAFDEPSGSGIPTAGRKRKPRARLDEATKEKIIAALKAGGKTAAQIAEDFKVSAATVNLLKAKAGLTSKRK